MSDEIAVAIYYGPLAWFRDRIDGTREQQEDLLDIVFDRDESARLLKVLLPGQHDPDPDPEQLDADRPVEVVAEAGDYASLNEHAITNFAGLIKSIWPRRLLLHNPPTHVRDQLRRTFKTTVEGYEYPHATRETLIGIRNSFADRIVGQDSVRDRLMAAMYPLTKDSRSKPVVLMFYGPSGVGKTETARFVSSLLGGTLLRKQFSMFHSDKFASYLFGGSHAEPSFAYDLLERESSVILMDEFDKANPVFHSAFYQLFDGGIFVDKNYTVELGNSLIICTSNYGSDKEVREALGEALYSRFDATLQFNRLTPAQIIQVVDQLIRKRLESAEPGELTHLDETHLRELLHPIANKTGNVRSLQKVVDELISHLLVRALVES